MHQNQIGEPFATGCQLEKMVRKGGELTYKCSGIDSSQVCDSNIYKRTIKYSSSLADRQQDCTFISFKNGGYTQHRTLERQQVHLELPSQQTNCNVCRVPSQCSKCTCRLGIKKCQGQFRMETKCFGFLRDCNTHGTTNSGFVCIQTLPPTSLRHCMETRPRPYSNRCIPSSLGWRVQFCFSSIQHVKSGFKEYPPRKNKPSDIVTPTWQTQPWYVQLLKMSVQPPFLLSQIRHLLKNPQGKNHTLVESGSLRLVVLKVSGKVCKWKEFQAMLPNLSHIQGEKAKQVITNRPEFSGLAGVMKDKLILFKHL